MATQAVDTTLIEEVKVVGTIMVRILSKAVDRRLTLGVVSLDLLVHVAEAAAVTGSALLITPKVAPTMPQVEAEVPT